MTHLIASYATRRKRNAPEPISACVVVTGARITGEIGVDAGASPGRRRHGSSHSTLEPTAQGLGSNHVALLACVKGDSEILDAPMVTEAPYAVIGDLNEVVAAMNVVLRRRKG
jgi:hypothetical protein